MAALLCALLSCRDATQPAVPEPPNEANVDRIELAPARDTLKAIRDTVRLTASARDRNGALFPVPQFRWFSSNISVLTIDSAGLATAQSQGSAEIIVRLGSVESRRLMVVRQVPARVEMATARDTVISGDTLRVQASVKDANGFAIANSAVQWTSSDSTIAVVNQSGLVIARRAGPGQIIARSQTASATAAVAVVYTLLIDIEDGVVGEPAAGITYHGANAVVPYTYGAANGFEQLTVTSGDTLMAPGGIIRVASNRVVRAAAPVVSRLPVGGEAVRDAMLALLSAAGQSPAAIAAGYQRLVDAQHAFSRRYSVDQAKTGLDQLRALTQDAMFDSVAIRQINRALSGAVFYPLGAAASALPVFLNQAAEAVTGDIVPVPTTVFYINGALTDESEAAETRDLLEQIIRAKLDIAPEDIRHYHNSTWFGREFTQSTPQFIRMLTNWNAGNVEASQLAARIRAEMGLHPARNVILVSHSQGAMVAQMALDRLSEAETNFVGLLTLSGPINSGVSSRNAARADIVIRGDAILNFRDAGISTAATAPIATNYSNRWVDVLTGLRNRWCGFAFFCYEPLTFRYGQLLHSVDDSYLSPTGARVPVQNAIVDLYRTLAERSGPRAKPVASGQGRTAGAGEVLSLGAFEEAAQATLSASGSVSGSRAWIDQIEWMLGGRVIGKGMQITHVFGTGIHSVTLRVTNNRGIAHEAQVTIAVGATVSPPIPHLNLRGAGQSVLAGGILAAATPSGNLVDVVFDASNSTGGSGTIATVEWFVNETYLSKQTVFTARLSAGLHSVKLRVTNTLGLAATATGTVQIVDQGSAPTALLNLTAKGGSVQESGTLDVPVNATEQVTSAFDGRRSLGGGNHSITSYEWYVDQAPAGSGATRSFALNPGTHIIALIVTNQIGLKDTAQATLRLTNACTRAAQLVSKSHADGTPLSPGQRFTMTWRLRNTGSCTWDQTYGFKVQESSSDRSSAENEKPHLGSTANNEVHAFSVAMLAPSRSGQHYERWTLVAPDGSPIADLWVRISVGPGNSTVALVVTGSGWGTGMVTSSPGGIQCNVSAASQTGACSAYFPTGTRVTLTPAPGAEQHHVGWSGACNGPTTICSIQLDQAQSVAVDFDSSIAKRRVWVNAGNGTASGRVFSVPGGIDCHVDSQGTTGACSAVFPAPGPIVLRAESPAGNSFDTWTGSCLGSLPNCDLKLDRDQNVIASFTSTSLNRYSLRVDLSGAGAGRITSQPEGIDCALVSGSLTGVCMAGFSEGQAVKLSASSGAAAFFSGWSGESCEGTGSCDLVMNRNRSVSAAFRMVEHSLTVQGSGTGSGRITSVPAGIDCRIVAGAASGACNGSFGSTLNLTLSATADAGSNFDAWSGACVGQSSCQFNMAQDRLVGAAFSQQTRALSVSGAGSGVGRVTSQPSGIDCSIAQGETSGACAANFAFGTSVTLSAAPDANHTFSWGGACAGTSCAVTLDQNRAVTATFQAPIPAHLLTVQGSGTGIGRVTSVPSGIDCRIVAGTTSGTCSANFVSTITVSLNAVADDEGSTFDAWSGACSGQTSCQFTMAQGRVVTAAFSQQMRSLTVSGAGSGVGRVTSQPAGIDCSVVQGTATGACAANFVIGTSVTLTAAPDPNHTFSWSGACSGSSSCALTLGQNRVVTATFEAPPPPPLHSLTVQGSGAGSGRVMSVPAGIDCQIVAGTGSGACTANFVSTATVTLSAVADAGSTFDAWSGACSGQTSCQVTMSQDRLVGAAFSQQMRSLSVSGAGSGVGRVTSQPAGIDCSIVQGVASGACGSSFVIGTNVTLTAAPDPNHTFSWSGACSGVASCAITLDQDRAVTATFVAPPLPHTLTVQGSGAGSGRVTSVPAGIDCHVVAGAASGACNASFVSTVTVTLSAVADAGSTFDAWSGACSGQTACQFTMAQDRLVGAAFSQQMRSLSVSGAGSGAGRVTSQPAGIDCSITQGQTTGACASNFVIGTNVTLTAAPDPNHTFSWSGACSGVAACAITLDQDRAVTATFVAPPPVFTLTVNGNGFGNGTVTAQPPGIDCQIANQATTGTCSSNHLSGETVVLTAVPAPGHTFDGWSGACTGSNPCQVQLLKNEVATARFSPIPPLIQLSPTNVTLTVGVGGDDAVTADVAVTNVGAGTLSGLTATVVYPPNARTGWLTTVMSGTAPTTLRLRAQPAGLPAGTYQATVTVTSPVAGNSPQVVSVTFVIKPDGNP